MIAGLDRSAGLVAGDKLHLAKTVRPCARISTRLTVKAGGTVREMDGDRMRLRKQERRWQWSTIVCITEAWEN